MAVSSKHFNFNSQRKEFFAEMSSLPKFRWEQVYNDSCDEGFTMVSKNTGDQVTFVVDRINTDADGDIITKNGLHGCSSIVGNDYMEVFG
jgi:hypothetical protein